MKFISVVLLFISLIYADDINISENNLSEINETVLKTVVKEDINISQDVWEFKQIDPFISQKDMKIAILISKKKFFKYIPELMNSVNAYLIKKDITYSIKLIDIPEDSNLTSILDNVSEEYTYIFTYFTDDRELQQLNNYPYNYFFIPTINKKDTNLTSNNIFFGGIDYDTQVSKLNELVDGFTIIYNSKKLSISNKLSIKESNVINFPYSTLYFENQNYRNKTIKDSNLILNTNSVMSAQILSNLTFHNNEPRQILSTQINYNPLIFTLTQKDSIKNMIIVNSISKSNPIINDNNLLLNTNIKYNWLNFSSSILMNKAYSLENNYNEFYANDFYLYMFHNQINYNTKLYKIEKNSFKNIKEKE
jgi:hypothetical protein